ncbi:MAG: SRPBCC family protein [Silvibacterium sp.]|jgi:hypothetical protein
MSNIAWEMEHSVETNASRTFVWKYMSDVENWDDPPATFHLEGPFEKGSHGTTEIPGQATIQWRLRDVEPQNSYTMEIALDGAVISCQWVFEELRSNRTELTQRIILEGDKAMSYENDVRRTFDLTLAPGMSRIAAAVDQAYESDLIRSK